MKLGIPLLLSLLPLSLCSPSYLLFTVSASSIVLNLFLILYLTATWNLVYSQLATKVIEEAIFMTCDTENDNVMKPLVYFVSNTLYVLVPVLQSLLYNVIECGNREGGLEGGILAMGRILRLGGNTKIILNVRFLKRFLCYFDFRILVEYVILYLNIQIYLI